MTSATTPVVDAVVVGGGVLGASCAYSLASEGLRVVLVERLHLASGASSSCQSGIGYGVTMDDDELAYYLAATRAYHDLAQEADIDYREDGALVLPEPGDEPALRLKVEALKARGVPSAWLDEGDLRLAEPRISVEFAGAALLTDTAQVSPMRVVIELASRAKRLGVSVRTNTTVLGIDLSGDRVAAVQTTGGRIATEWVVIAAGAWSRDVGSLANLKVPVWPLKGHVIVSEPLPRRLRYYISEERYDKTVSAMRATSMSDDGPEPTEPRVASVLQSLPSGSILIGSSREFAGFDRTVVRERLAALARSACNVVPDLRGARALRTYAGLRPWTPDGKPLIGPTSQVRGIAFATGHGGEGNTGALLGGRLLAELIVGRKPSVNASRFSPDRFSLL